MFALQVLLVRIAPLQAALQSSWVQCGTVGHVDRLDFETSIGTHRAPASPDRISLTSSSRIMELVGSKECSLESLQAGILQMKQTFNLLGLRGQQARTHGKCPVQAVSVGSMLAGTTGHHSKQPKLGTLNKEPPTALSFLLVFVLPAVCGEGVQPPKVSTNMDWKLKATHCVVS